MPLHTDTEIPDGAVLFGALQAGDCYCYYDQDEVTGMVTALHREMWQKVVTERDQPWPDCRNAVTAAGSVACEDDWCVVCPLGAYPLPGEEGAPCEL